jgi:dCMP deaminase
MRLLRHQLFMEVAHVVSKRSTCVRLNVGAIISYRNRPVSWGWNGAAAGEPHCPGHTCPGSVPGNCPTIHAEQNALAFARPLVPLEKCDLYVTHSPCSACAEVIARDRLRRVMFSVPYRDPKPLEILAVASIKVYQITPAGQLIDALSGELMEGLPDL